MGVREYRERKFEIEEVRFDPSLKLLVGPEGSVPLRPQSNDVLRVLVSRSGTPVSKQELVDAVWHGQPASDDSVYQCISEIRRALGDRGRTLIRTISGKGYAITNEILVVTPRAMKTRLDGAVKDVLSTDGTRIAWMATGDGIPVLKTPNWITHLGAERESLLYVPFYERLGKIARIVRYDQRGGGMSSWHVPPLSIEAMCDDINCVAEEAGLERFFLLGLSQGVAFSIAYAAKYPNRVLGIIGRGGYALGELESGTERNRQSYEAALKLAEIGWESDDPGYRRYFTSRIAPDAPSSILKQFDDLQRIAVPKENLRNFIEFDAWIDVTREARQISCPVLLIHARGDRMVPFEDGRALAKTFPKCEFVPLKGDNHVLVPGSPDFDYALERMEGFLRQNAVPSSSQ